jgi:hypothetical protein
LAENTARACQGLALPSTKRSIMLELAKLKLQLCCKINVFYFIRGSLEVELNHCLQKNNSKIATIFLREVWNPKKKSGSI